MLNSGFRGKRATDGTGAISAQTQSVQATDPVPKITGYAVTDSSYVAFDDTAATSGAIIVVYGNNFVSGMTVYINNSLVAATYLDSTRITFIAPTLSNGTYIIYMTTPQGGAAILSPGIVYSGFPTWTTSNYNTSDTTINIQLLASGDAPLTYSLQGGSTLPTGITLTSTGVLTGTATSVTNDSVFYFTVIVEDTQLQGTQQSITLTFQFGDSYWKNTTLLLNGETTVKPFINDASVNSFGLTINGDTKPVLFNPYTPGYYSNYFDGTGDYLNTPYSATMLFSANNFTIEAFIYPTTAGVLRGVCNNWQSGGEFYLDITSGNVMKFGYNNVASGLGTVDYIGTTQISATVWTHVAVVRNGNSLSMYINGVLDASGSRDVTGQTLYYYNGATKDFRIGVGGDLGGYFTGYINNLRVVNGTAVYTSAFTPPTTPLTAIANTSLLTCQSNRLIDNSTNAFTITKNGDTIVSPNNPFTPNSSYSTYGSTYFDGTGDFLSAPNNSALDLGSGDYTIEGWWYFTDTSNQALISKYTGNNGYVVQYQANNLRMVLGLGSSDAVYSFAWTAIPNTWNHVAITRSGTSGRAFINGVQIGSTTTFTTSNTIGATTLQIGSTHTVSELTRGYVTDVRIVKGTAVYTSAFTPSTSPLTAIANTSLLTLQYNGGATNQAIIDNSNFNNIITRNGNASQGSFSPYSMTGWSNYFDGSGDYLDVTTGIPVPVTGQFTFETWVYTTKVNGATSQMIYSQYSTSNANRWTINISTANKLQVSHPSLNVIGATTVPVNQWNHIAITRDASNTLRIFLNGEVDATSASYTYSIFQDPPRIGYYKNTPNDYFTGYISNLRVVSGTAVYTTTFTPPTSPLTAISGTSLLTCQSNRLIDNSPNNFAITKTGEVSVQAFSPFGSIREAIPISYSNYFDGTGDQLITTTSANLALQSNDFTVELWYYPTGRVQSYPVLISNGNFGSQKWQINDRHSSSPTKVSVNLHAGSSGDGWLVSTTTISVNTWYHVALVRSGSTFTLYINGAGEQSKTLSGSITASTDFISLGQDQNQGVTCYTGYISNARIVNGTAVYTSNFTPSTTPLTAIANTSLLTCQSTTMIDNSTNRFTITAAGNTVPRIFNPFGYTAQSATSYTPTTHGGSAYFDGAGDYLTAPYNPYLFGSNDFTVECWIYPVAALTSTPIVGVWRESASSSSNSSWSLRGGLSNTIYFYHYTSGGTFTSLNSATGAYSLNTWNHLAVVRYGSTLSIYVNGVLYNSAAISVSLASPTTTNLGIAADATTGGVGLNTYISDLRIINGTALYTSSFVPPTTSVTAIPKTSLLLNFNKGGIIDQHGSNVLETVGNAQLSTAVKKYGSASMYFDGTGDYLTIPTNPGFVFGTGDFTIEAWFYIVSGAAGAIFDTRSGATGITPLLFFSSSTLRYYVNGADLITSPTTLSAATWYHVALVRSSGSSKMYLNGAQTGSTVADVNNFTLTNTINIGRGNDNNNVLNGYIDELRVTKGFARYTANFTAPTTAFLGQ